MRINCTGSTILVVDDDDNSLLLLVELLQQSGATILTAINGKSAMEIIEALQVDLILLDIKLTDSDGYDLIRQIKLIQPTILSIAQTAMTMEIVSKFKEVGFNDYISKPISSKLLFSKIEALLYPQSQS